MRAFAGTAAGAAERDRDRDFDNKICFISLRCEGEEKFVLDCALLFVSCARIYFRCSSSLSCLP